MELIMIKAYRDASFKGLYYDNYNVELKLMHKMLNLQYDTMFYI